ncbi:MAG: hypothetical protein HOV80_29490 [Polyangiaceae bacterium]|nr:hypothetical protein [Polyangiaceae bacterium]
MARLVASLVLTFAWGCSSSTPEPAQTSGGDPQPTSEPPPADTADPEPASTGNAAPQASGAAQPREILRKDCLSLADKYAELVRIDEAAKLNPKLNDAQRETAKQNIDKAAKTLADRFAEGCEKSLVGKFADEASLQCAMNSKRLADFDVCMNGPAPGPAK